LQRGLEMVVQHSSLWEKIYEDGYRDDGYNSLDETGRHLLDDEDGNDDDEKGEDVVGHGS